MQIIKNELNLETSRVYSVEKYLRSGEIQRIEQEIVCEQNVQILLNGKLVSVIVCTALDLAELAIGHLYSEGIISHADKIETVVVSRDGKKVEVTSKSKLSTDFILQRINTCNVDENSNGIGKAYADIHPLQKRNWQKEWVFAMSDAFSSCAPLHNKTSAAHCCMLSYKGEIKYRCEDIGRHNALDKVIGYALEDSLDASDCMVYCSGRIPIDMLKKTVISGIPVLISHSAPTRGSVELAKRCNSTLICSARKDYMVVYNDASPGKDEDSK